MGGRGVHVLRDGAWSTFRAGDDFELTLALDGGG
jgi:hypothetical protein